MSCIFPQGPCFVLTLSSQPSPLPSLLAVFPQFCLIMKSKQNSDFPPTLGSPLVSAVPLLSQLTSTTACPKTHWKLSAAPITPRELLLAGLHVNSSFLAFPVSEGPLPSCIHLDPSGQAISWVSTSISLFSPASLVQVEAITSPLSNQKPGAPPDPQPPTFIQP